MTAKERDPYSRHYWRLIDDTKFAEVYADDHHYATWSRLLMIADQAWPASAHLPSTARRASVRKLAEVGLVDLLPDGRFRMHGTDAERHRRSDLARDAAGHRWSNAERNAASNANGYAERNADASALGMPSKAEQSNTEQSKATQSKAETPRAIRRNGPEPIAAILPDVLAGPPEDAFGVSEDEHRVFAFLARFGAAIRPDTGYGRRLLGLIERRGVEDVLRHAGVMAKSGERLSDRQWVFGLEAALEAVPSGREAQVAERAEDERQLHEKRLERTRQQNAALLALRADVPGGVS
jgi:hypothetical protein